MSTTSEREARINAICAQHANAPYLANLRLMLTQGGDLSTDDRVAAIVKRAKDFTLVRTYGAWLAASRGLSR